MAHSRCGYSHVMFKDIYDIAIIECISTWQKYRQCESKMAERTRITITVAGESVTIRVQSDNPITALEVCD